MTHRLPLEHQMRLRRPDDRLDDIRKGIRILHYPDPRRFWGIDPDEALHQVLQNICKAYKEKVPVWAIAEAAECTPNDVRVIWLQRDALTPAQQREAQFAAIDRRLGTPPELVFEPYVRPADPQFAAAAIELLLNGETNRGQPAEARELYPPAKPGNACTALTIHFDPHSQTLTTGHSTDASTDDDEPHEHHWDLTDDECDDCGSHLCIVRCVDPGGCGAEQRDCGD